MISDYSEANPYGLTIDASSDPLWRIGRLEIPDAPLTEWGVIVGDVAHNLRSALDHLVFQLAILNQEDPEGMNTQFPIFRKEDDYLAVGNRGSRKGKLSARDSHLWGVADADKAIIDGLQPFNAGDRAHLHPLAILNQISNRDKHRLVTASHGAMEDRSVEAIPTDPGINVEIKEAELSGLVEEGVELFRYRVLPDPNAEVQFRFKAKHWIGFAGDLDQVPPISVEALSALMMEIADIIHSFEVDRFKPHN
jgi:hypothetical protein